MEENRQSMDYQNGKIYSIRSYQTELIYIGSTTQSLSKRLSKHKTDFDGWNNNNNAYAYVSSFDILKYDDYYIELVENYSCNSKNELRRREGEIIRITDKCVNKNIAGRTKKQYYEDNKEHISEYQKEYNETNKEKIIEYRKTNKEYLSTKNKEYREQNKLKLLKKIECECGGKYVYKNKSVHCKSQKHCKFIDLK
jgi:hypothetical protein